MAFREIGIFFYIRGELFHLIKNDSNRRGCAAAAVFYYFQFRETDGGKFWDRRYRGKFEFLSFFPRFLVKLIGDGIDSGYSGIDVKFTQKGTVGLRNVVKFNVNRYE